MGAVDPGPSVSPVAGQGAVGAGAAEGAPDLGAANQQAGGTVEGQPRGEFGGFRETRYRRGAAASYAKVSLESSYCCTTALLVCCYAAFLLSLCMCLVVTVNIDKRLSSSGTKMPTSIRTSLGRS